ncbi:hypothetical protein K7W03_26820 [Sphingobium sp. PNB]|uniref:hypothetical protein n=1 Tax=Sphingobium sp. PNB TaxID=863934 RepID=UPI001CA3BA36|nr:hypothetical protein [Sphingobium sp. PNB]MCB4863190.1 hypothetical protein [Sphingobium sp. PNB]
MGEKHWSIKTALEQITKCDFVCEAGPLAHNQAWAWLEAAAKVGPEFWPGQGVWFEVEAEVAGVKLKQAAHFYIVACAMESDIERRYWTYSLSADPPAPYHYGNVHFRGVRGDKLMLENPEAKA